MLSCSLFLIYAFAASFIMENFIRVATSNSKASFRNNPIVIGSNPPIPRLWQTLTFLFMIRVTGALAFFVVMANHPFVFAIPNTINAIVIEGHVCIATVYIIGLYVMSKNLRLVDFVFEVSFVEGFNNWTFAVS